MSGALAVTFTLKVPSLLLTFFSFSAVRVTSAPAAEANLKPGLTKPSAFLTDHLIFETSVEAVKPEAVNFSEILSPAACVPIEALLLIEESPDLIETLIAAHDDELKASRKNIKNNRNLKIQLL